MSRHAGQQPKPYQPPALKVNGAVEPQRQNSSKWTFVVLFAFILNGTFPFYGFYVHANRDHQVLAYVLVATWYLNWVVVGVLLPAYIAFSKIGLINKAACIVVILMLVMAGVYSKEGTIRAVGELLM
jgi:ABC-type glycerol-3-phosphate transport system permease component